MQPINEMELFCAVVDGGSFTEAGRRLALPTSTVSRHVSRLEQRLSAKLLHRSTRHMSTTDLGQAYYLRCRRILEDIAEAEEAVRQHQETVRGRLKISAPPTSAQFPLLDDLVPLYQARYPEVELEVELSTRFVDLIGEGFDVALRAGALSDSNLTCRRLVNVPARLHASRAYLDAHGRPTRIDELEHHRCLVQNASNPSRWPRLDGTSFRVVGALASNSLDLLRTAMIAGQGIALLPGAGIADEIARGEVEELLGEQVGASVGLYLVYPPGRFLAARVRAFIDLCVEHIRDKGYAG